MLVVGSNGYSGWNQLRCFASTVSPVHPGTVHQSSVCKCNQVLIWPLPRIRRNCEHLGTVASHIDWQAAFEKSRLRAHTLRASSSCLRYELISHEAPGGDCGFRSALTAVEGCQVIRQEHTAFAPPSMFTHEAKCFRAWYALYDAISVNHLCSRACDPQEHATGIRTLGRLEGMAPKFKSSSSHCRS
jgi:hypothetical protein